MKKQLLLIVLDKERNKAKGMTHHNALILKIKMLSPRKCCPALTAPPTSSIPSLSLKYSKAYFTVVHFVALDLEFWTIYFSEKQVLPLDFLIQLS